MAGLTTHILDTAHGCPAAGVTIDLGRVSTDGSCVWVKSVITNADGRCDAPLLSPDVAEVGIWRLRFAIGDYFRRRGVVLPEPAFVDIVHIDFGLANPSEHYHVPLLVSPFSYSTYRGS